MQTDNRFCRNCSHHRDGHITPGICYCPEYVPKDNLEYLEYCEAKRNSNETAKR